MDGQGTRTAELVGVLSVATDLGTGQPFEQPGYVRGRAAATVWAFEQDLLQTA